MSNEIVYNVGDIKKIIKESSQEFKAKLGNNVSWKDNALINQESYKDSEKRAKDFNGGLNNKKPIKVVKPDFNKTTLDASFAEDPDKNYKDRVKAQAKGYTSKMEEDNDIEKNGDFDKNEEIYDSLKKSHDEIAKNVLANKKSGLAAREMPDETFEKDSMYENKLKTKRLTFKHTKFLCEEHMLSRIPDEYKINGQCIIMKDAADNEYFVKWKVDNEKNISEGEVLNYSNKTKLNEELKRIKDLYNYKSSQYFNTTNAQSRLSEDSNVGNFIKNVKNLK